ncbi:PAS domain S-box-containing protein [Desulfuromusa kysingii]|uniref:histidine kinase n=1 Tax=Desulfuromusa kysingii TaxID=37625 RepID=A0A1H4AG87_9BACT|nr:ATP-binding protein [Desulfuromusa kysingii]SEA35029.1 PAS domain S-box-containing protein [Desulfuromusa kysingii]
MEFKDKQEIKELFDDYVRMYASRDDQLTDYFSADFSGFTGGGDFLVKDRDTWVEITRQDFAQVKEPLQIELLDLSVQSLSETLAVATGFFHIHLPIKDEILSRETARLVLIFRQESHGWKICHSSISIPYNLVRDGEVYPLQKLVESHRVLEEQVAERTQQLSEVNATLQQVNEQLAHEIAEHQKANKARQESEAHFRLIAENVSDVVWKLDRDYRFTYISPSDERLRGYRADEVLGQHIFELFDEAGVATVKKFAAARLQAELQGINTGSIMFEARHRCKDGRWLWVEVSATPERDADGAVIGHYGISREITERKQIEDEVRQAKAAAEEANKAKSQFLASISHEIRTPLNSLLGFSTLARTTTNPEKLDQYLNILEQSSRSLMALVNDILDMSKIEAERMQVDAVPFSLQQLISQLEDQYRPLAEGKSLVFNVVVNSDVSNWYIGDPVRVRQILDNLLNNAIKFTHKGEVNFTLGLNKSVADVEQQRLCFEICDTGIGIPGSYHDQLFQPFRQLDPSITRQFGGTGLGLAIVHSLVMLMQGEIRVNSHEGLGSCFIVELPLKETEVVAEDHILSALTTRVNTLLVEDNEFNRLLLADILLSWGHQVVLAENGQQALQLVDHQTFDLILLDVRMPDINGIEVARQIRKNEQERVVSPLPIIAITADADTVTRTVCFEAGMNAVLAKPIIPEQLARTIAIHLNMPLTTPVGEVLPLNVQTQKGLGDDPVRTCQYHDLLRNDIDAELQRLHRALQQQKRSEMELSAHTLKGLLAQLSNPALAKQAKWLQQNAEAPFAQLQQAVDKLESDCQHLTGCGI